MEQTTKLTTFAAHGMNPAKPDPQRIFYANLVSWVFNQQEAFIDFKFVMPEDYRIKKATEQGGMIEAPAQFDAAEIPIEARIILPRLQFDSFVKKLLEIYGQTTEIKETKDAK